MDQLDNFPLHPNDVVGRQFIDRISHRLNTGKSLDDTDKAWGDFVVEPALKPHIEALKNVRTAAVLFGLVNRPEGLSLVLVKRSAALRAHPGQVGLPGGKIEANESPNDTALRETFEEIGLPAETITLLGSLPAYRTGSAYNIHPILGLIDNNAPMVADGHEIVRVFSVPLAHLFNPEHHLVQRRAMKSINRRFYLIPYQPDPIWGITAGIIHMVYESLYRS